MKRTTFLRQAAALGLGLSALCASARASAQGDAQVENGFALQASIAARTGLLQVTNINNNNVALPGNGVDAGLFAGYKFGRAIFGLGLEFFNVTIAPTGPGAGMSQSSSVFLIGPELQIAVVRVADNRVDLFFDAALHFGHEFIPNNNPPPPPIMVQQPSNFLLSYQLGPGVRFWAHRHFAISGLTGFSGVLVHEIPPANQPNGENDSVHGIFAQIGMLGVF
jgi:hypothetical protein